MLWRELFAEMATQLIETDRTQIVVEVVQKRRQHVRLDTFVPCALRQRGCGAIARSIGVAHDIENTQRCGQQHCREMVGGQSRRHREVRQRIAERQHRFDAFTCRENVLGCAEAHGIAKEMAHGTARRRDGSLALTGPIKPGAMNAGDRTAQIRDGRDQCRPDLGLRVRHRAGNSSADGIAAAAIRQDA